MSSNRIGRIGQWDGNSNDSNSSRSRGQFATLRDLASSAGGGGTGGGNHGSDGEDGGDDEQGEGAENWYAGGERSGLSVENPDRRPENNVVRDILRKAAGAAAPQPSSSAAASSRAFTGGGYTLGSDEVESSYISDPNGNEDAEDQEVALRNITFWRDGFSVEDGPLMRYDDPGNEHILEEINTGHAPPQILNVRVGQPVELRVTRRLNEDYIPPPKGPLEAFEGHGQRLGTVVPNASSSREPAPVQVDRDRMQTRFEVDQSLPTTSVHVRLADGTRLAARMNLTHTIQDIRNFINASTPGSSNVMYTINTAYPNRVLEDESRTIEQAGLANSVVLQRLL